jgi:hypothetical protein
VLREQRKHKRPFPGIAPYPAAPFNRRPRSHLLGPPSWETVEAPDLDYHVRHVVLPPSTDEHGPLEHVARMHEPPGQVGK